MSGANASVIGSALAALLAGSATAADMPMHAPTPVYQAVVPPPVLFTWTGCYLGVEGGGAWGQSRHDSVNGAITDTYSINGATAGGTLGCNYQVGLLVAGIEADLSWVDKYGRGPDLPPFSVTAVSSTRETWLGTVRGRFGFAPDDRWLIYVTGGYAAARVEAQAVDAPLNIDVTAAKVRSGWTAGLGLEWVFWQSWSAKLEYLYVGLGNASYFDAPPPGVTTRTGVPVNDHLLRVGINWRFI
jgi:outer membrane immunogenic protein